MQFEGGQLKRRKQFGTDVQHEADKRDVAGTNMERNTFHRYGIYHPLTKPDDPKVVTAVGRVHGKLVVSVFAVGDAVLRAAAVADAASPLHAGVVYVHSHNRGVVGARFLTTLFA